MKERKLGGGSDTGQTIVCQWLRVTNRRWLGFRLRELVLDAKLGHMWRRATPL